MQYILTEEEFTDLQKKASANLNSTMPSKKELQKFCTMIANTVPVKSGWYKDKIWGCIITKENSNPEDEDYEPEWYCDECPAREVCPYEYKTWSK